jgi:glucose dehydrogenase
LISRILQLFAIAAVLPAQVPYERIVNGAKEPQNWFTYSGSYAGTRHSNLNQITPQNVARLGVQWVFQSRMAEKLEATPLVVDGVMYISEATGNVYALDAASGAPSGNSATLSSRARGLVVECLIAVWRSSKTLFF